MREHANTQHLLATCGRPGHYALAGRGEDDADEGTRLSFESCTEVDSASVVDLSPLMLSLASLWRSACFAWPQSGGSHAWPMARVRSVCDRVRGLAGLPASLCRLLGRRSSVGGGWACRGCPESRLGWCRSRRPHPTLRGGTAARFPPASPTWPPLLRSSPGVCGWPTPMLVPCH